MNDILLEKVQDQQQLCSVIEQVGILPLFECGIKGFSAHELTRDEDWFSGNADVDPWEWRKTIAASGRIAYGKFINNKSAFVSREMVPLLVSLRREGADGQELYENGKMSRKAHDLLELFDGGIILPSYEVKARAGFGKGGQSGFEGALTQLQMQLLITVRGYERKRNRSGAEYGWPVGYYSAMDSLFGREHVQKCGLSAERAQEMIIDRLSGFMPWAGRQEIIKCIK